MWFDVNPRSDVPIYQQLVDGVKKAVARGILAPGDKLPSVRELAGRIAINPNTIAKAYQELEREGIIETLRGRGSFIAEVQARSIDREEKKRRMREMLEKVLVEAYYMQMEEEEVLAMVEEIIREWYRERRG
ncbi:GntR family transcriptional regulator [Planifilum fulgidum]|uniref:GntR family transcriptional regulator n=1 Tax=Planifilum fulgidum TaxID=201973 RepID=A0A1I2NK20_9BACL|nr:GntR family transcriptional regulator [Planifilum fulgidum]